MIRSPEPSQGAQQPPEPARRPRPSRHPAVPTPVEARLHSRRATADRLSISLRTLDTLVSQGALRPTRITTRRVGFSEAELARFIAAMTR